MMNLRQLFKRKPKADDEQIEAELAKAEVVHEDKPKGRVHNHTKRPAWSLNKPKGGGVRRNMPKSLRKLKESADD
jgi:hypothetical protein